MHKFHKLLKCTPLNGVIFSEQIEEHYFGAELFPYQHFLGTLTSNKKVNGGSPRFMVPKHKGERNARNFLLQMHFIVRRPLPSRGKGFRSGFMICNSFSLTLEKAMCNYQIWLLATSGQRVVHVHFDPEWASLFWERHYSLVGFFPLSFFLFRSHGKSFFSVHSFSVSPFLPPQLQPSLVIHHEVGSDSQSGQMEWPQHPDLMSFIMVWYLDWSTIWLGLGRLPTIDIRAAVIPKICDSSSIMTPKNKVTPVTQAQESV